MIFKPGIIQSDPINRPGTFHYYDFLTLETILGKKRRDPFKPRLNRLGLKTMIIRCFYFLILSIFQQWMLLQDFFLTKKEKKTRRKEQPQHGDDAMLCKIFWQKKQP